VLTFDVDAGDRPLRLLCIGAHCDDIEIGCGGTVLEWLSRHPKVEATWVVLCAHGERAAEARRSAAAFLRRADRRSLLLHPFLDGYFPAQYDQIKRTFADLAATIAPDVVFTHTLEDRHQDHRLVAELTWQTFRDHLVLEFDIPKYEGDSGQPNLFVPLSASAARRKVANLMRHFGSQRSKDWFRPETFAATMHLRGLECRAPSGSAEAFRARKLVVDRRAARNG
jgi:LmbE family N-acetylglucosaminyl deacetylase